MRHVDEYRDAAAIASVVRRIRETATRRWTLMEVCGGQTHSILKFGIDELLPETVELIHGPGCPVCVTPLELIDRAIAIAARPDVIFCSFGDMLRVPGSSDDLLKVKARGGDVRIVYSPLDALRLARQHPEREVVFFAVGFETTAPANAMAVHRAARRGARELLAAGLARAGAAGDGGPPRLRGRAHRRPPRGGPRLHGDGLPRLRAARRAPPRPDRRHRLRAARPAPGHPGGRAPARARRGAGREPVRARGACATATRGARAMVEDVFVVSRPDLARPRPDPAERLRARARATRAFDAEQRLRRGEASPSASRRSAGPGVVLQGRLRPTDCPAFGTRCTPEHPLGATMVSTEGACAAYFHYRRAPAGAAASRRRGS